MEVPPGQVGVWGPTACHCPNMGLSLGMLSKQQFIWKLGRITPGWCLHLKIPSSCCTEDTVCMSAPREQEITTLKLKARVRSRTFGHLGLLILLGEELILLLGFGCLHTLWTIILLETRAMISICGTIQSTGDAQTCNLWAPQQPCQQWSFQKKDIPFLQILTVIYLLWVRSYTNASQILALSLKGSWSSPEVLPPRRYNGDEYVISQAGKC